MRRRHIALFVGVISASRPLGAFAQQSRSIRRIGYVTSVSDGGPSLDAFRQALAQVGYVEGHNLIIETRFAMGRMDAVPNLIGELIRRNIEVLVTGGTPVTVAARKETAAVPIVFAGVADAVGAGLVSSLARPGGNVTGITVGISEAGFTAKCLQLFKEVAPSVRHLAAILNPAHPLTLQFSQEIDQSSRDLAMTFELHKVRDVTELDRALVAVGAGGTHGLFVAPDPMLTDSSARIARFAVQRGLPSFHFSRRFVDAGGLVSYGASLTESYRRAAGHVDRILKGARPADLPVEQPDRFELVINLRTARALGLTFPSAILARADDVIE